MYKSSRDIGNYYEELAAKYLIKEKYEIIKRNYYYCNEESMVHGLLKKCEIDIIAIKDNILYFFEVRKRKFISDKYPVISPIKIRNIYECAHNFIYYHPQYKNHNYTVDLIVITEEKSNNISIVSNITMEYEYEF